jgi:hypothetical protein
MDHWETRLMQRFSANPDTLNGPVTLVDEQGIRWVLHRKRLDVRVVRRLVKDHAAPAYGGTWVESALGRSQRPNAPRSGVGSKASTWARAERGRRAAT